MKFLLPLLLLVHAAMAAPNLVIINVDDLGYADIEPFGGATKTPHLQRMAREGMLLKSHYGAVVCSPSRAALMTGCYPKRVLQIPHVLFPNAAVGLNPQEQNIAKVLKTAGYTTMCIGKWHLGDQPEFLPLKQGFDRYFGLPYSNDMGPAEDGTKSNFGQPVPAARPNAKAAPPRDDSGGRGKQPPLALLEGDRVVERVRQKEQETLTSRYTERAVGFIREQAGAGKPFFLYLAHSAVHFPFYPHESQRGKTGSLLTDVVSEIDASTGKILGALAGTETLVVFTSDNGGSVPHGSVNKPLRGGKGQVLEGGIRVPTIAWWPGKVRAGSSTDAMTSMMDLLPTFAAAAGAKLDPERKIDGVNLLGLLKGATSMLPRQDFLYFTGGNLQAVRSGPWKLHLAKQELYNLQEDVGESRNVAVEQPEQVKRLQALAESMGGDLGTEGFGPGCRAMGRVENPRPLIAADAQ